MSSQVRVVGSGYNVFNFLVMKAHRACVMFLCQSIQINRAVGALNVSSTYVFVKYSHFVIKSSAAYQVLFGLFS